MEKANVTWMGKENQSEDPKAEAKRIDDYMNNEEPAEWEPQSLEEALLGEWLRGYSLVVKLQPSKLLSSVRIRLPALASARYVGYPLPSRR